MEVSRRFGSRFMVSFTKPGGGAGGRVVEGLASVTYARVAAPAVGYPPDGYYAFQADYYAGWGVQRFVAVNSAPASNALDLFPSSGVSWDDATWGRVPYNIRWYDDSKLVLTGSSASSTGRYSALYSSTPTPTYYRLRLSFWHQIEIKNNSEHPVTAFSRSLLKHDFPDSSSFGDDVMTSWASQEIAAGGSFLVAGFEPLEIKLNEDSTARDLLGITDQTGNRTLLLF